jgi:methylphosphotriester-DNA--protein-cysteine methyltransferase
MAEEQNLDNIIAKRRELKQLLMAEGQLSAQKAEALSREYRTLAEIDDVINSINREGQSFVNELDRGIEAGTQLYSISLGLTESIKESLGIQQRRNEFDKDLFKINKDIKNTLREQTDSLSSQRDIEKQIDKNLNKRLSATTVIKSLEESLSDAAQEQVEGVNQVFNARVNIEDQIKKELDLVAKGKPLNQDRLDYLHQQSALYDEQIDAQIGSLNPQQQQLLFTKQNVNALDRATKAQAKQLAKIEEVNKATGVTGSLLKGLSKIPGLDQVFKVEDLEDVKKEILESGKEANKLDIAGKLVSKSFGNLKTVLKDPAVVLSAIGKTLLNNSQLTNQFQSELGASYGSALAMRNELNNAAGASGDLFINSEKLQKSFFGLAENTGVFFDLSSKSAETFTNLTERIGLAGAEAGNLTMLLRLQGKDTETTMSNLVGTASAALATSKSTATVKQILGDVASSSKGLQASFAANPGALAKAAVAARELGASLKDIEGVQKSLLDFESSIGAELEAELLTGKQLNLEKARTAALNNDLKTVSEELLKQGVDLASFGEMNALQQEKMAAAMGMSRDVMADMLLKQQTQNMTADEVRKKFGDQTYEQFKALSAQDKFNASVAKLKDLFGSVMTALTPIIDVVAMILWPIGKIAQGLAYINELTGGFSNALIGVAIAAKALGMRFGAMFNPKTYAGFFSGLFNKVKGIQFGGIKDKIRGAFAPGSTDGFFSGLKDRFKGMSSPLKTLGDKLKGAFGGAADASKGIQFDPRMAGGGRFRDMASGRMVSEEAANTAGVFRPGTGPTAAAASGATDAASATGATPAPADDGKALKEKMQNIAEGIKSFANTEVVKGALSMIVAAPGLVALGLASLPLKITEKINGKAIETGMTGIANGIKAFGNTTKGALALLIATPGLLALGLAAPGLALIGVVGTGIAAGLKGISVGMGSLGKNMVNVIKGSIALSTLALPIAAASAAFSLLKGVDPSSMIAFSVSLGILGTAAAILGNMLPQVVLGALALTTLALPIAAASLAFSLLKGIDPSSMIAFSVSLGILGTAAAILGSMFPMVAMGALALTALALPIVAVSAAFSLLKGIDTSMIIGFATTLGILGLAAAGFGMVSPLIITGSVAIGALGLALLPLAVAMNVAAPAAEQFAQVLSSLGEINVANLFGIAIALPALAIGIGALALSIGTAVLAAISLKIVTSALEPLAEMAPKFDLTNKSLKGIATSVALLAASLNTLDAAKLETLSDFDGNINISSITASTTDQSNIATNDVDLTTATTTPNINTVDQTITTATTTTPNINTADQAMATVVSKDISGVISENVRTSTVDILRETLPNGEIKVVATVENPETGDRAEGVSVLPANSSERIQETAEQSAALKARGNLTSGVLSSTEESRAVGMNPNSPTGYKQGVTAEEIEGIVASTIKALVPEMVAAINDKKVVNDNFNNSRQSEGPSRNRNIVNNNFA